MSLDCTEAFHISVGWQLEMPSESQRETMGKIDSNGLSGISPFFDSVKLKVGNSVKSINL